MAERWGVGNARSYVLVVDDDDGGRAAIARLLHAEGIPCRGAESGAAAIAIAAETMPELVITDLEMPEMDGLDLLLELRRRGIDAPVVVATAHHELAAAVNAMRHGAVDYITKPIDADALLRAIDRALELHDLLREAAALRARNEALAAEAERNLRAREELLSIVAHDLRGWLSTIRLATRTPLSQPSEAEHRMATIDRAASRMQRLIEDLLDVSRIETGAMRLELAPQRGSSVLAEVEAAVATDAEKNAVHLDVSIDEDFVVSCAFDRIAQALTNLVANAIHVSKPGALVELRAGASSTAAWFTVEDHGPGIASVDLHQIFSRGFRAGGGWRRGAGLGLAIAKGIVEAHGGTIHVVSTVGRGTTFRVELPLESAPETSWRLSAPQPAWHAG